MAYTCEKTSDEYLRVNSCGRQMLGDKNYSVNRVRGRIDFHILYITRGFCYVYDNGRKIKIGKGNIILFYPGEQQRYEFYASDDPISCYIHFTGTGCTELLRKLSLCGRRYFQVGESTALDKIFTRMQNEHNLKKKFGEEMCAAYLTEFLYVAARIISGQSAGGERPDSAIDSVRKFMHENYSSNPGVKYYADKCSLSVSRFSHRFKSVTGESCLTYINRIRIEKAKEFLTETDCSVSDVAEMVGFSEQNYFCRIFKKYVGITPFAYSKKTL